MVTSCGRIHAPTNSIVWDHNKSLVTDCQDDAVATMYVLYCNAKVHTKSCLIRLQQLFATQHDSICNPVLQNAIIYIICDTSTPFSNNLLGEPGYGAVVPEN
jgi:hypothetical protein